MRRPTKAHDSQIAWGRLALAFDAEFKESDHPRDQDGQFKESGSGSSIGNKSSKAFSHAAYSSKPPLYRRSETQGTSSYIISNGMVRPYERGALLENPNSLLEYKIDVEHHGTRKVIGRIDHDEGGDFTFIADADKMQPVPYKLSSTPTKESVETQVGFNTAIKRGKKDGNWSDIDGKSEHFSDGYRQGLEELKSSSKEKIKEYISLLKSDDSAHDSQIALTTSPNAGMPMGTRRKKASDGAKALDCWSHLKRWHTTNTAQDAEFNESDHPRKSGKFVAKYGPGGSHEHRLHEMSGSKLDQEIAKLQALSSQVTTKFINSGRGYEKPTEIREKAKAGNDPLAEEYVHYRNELEPLQAHKERRGTHGEKFVRRQGAQRAAGLY